MGYNLLPLPNRLAEWLACCNSNGLVRSSNVRRQVIKELPERCYSYLRMPSSVPYITELEKHSAKNDYFGLAKSSRFDFAITKDDFEDP